MSIRRPRKYRFLDPFFSLSLPALLMLWGLSRRTGKVCDYIQRFAPNANCNFDLGYVPEILLGMFFVGLVASMYCFYRDYIEGMVHF